MRTEKTWRETEQDLAETFAKWGVREWQCDSAVLRSRHAVKSLSVEERRATVQWRMPDGTPMVLTMDDHATPPDNLRVLYLGVEALRLNDLRGISGLMGKAYLQLAAPVTTQVVDPWAHFGITPKTPAVVAKAAYRALANESHPDHGGSTEAFMRTQAAWDEIKEHFE